MAANAVLRAAILNAGLTPGMLAERVGVDAKTVQRWVSQGRRPHPVTRHAVSVAVGRSMAELWPAEDAPSAPMPVGDQGGQVAVLLDRLLLVAAHLDRLTERLEVLERRTASLGVSA